MTLNHPVDCDDSMVAMVYGNAFENFPFPM